MSTWSVKKGRGKEKKEGRGEKRREIREERGVIDVYRKTDTCKIISDFVSEKLRMLFL